MRLNKTLCEYTTPRHALTKHHSRCGAPRQYAAIGNAQLYNTKTTDGNETR